MRIKRRTGKFVGDYQLCLASRLAVALIRGSTREQLNTLATQEMTATHYAQRFNFELLDCIIDSGTSAEKVRFFDRPKAQEAIALMQIRNCFNLLVTKTDRAFRNHEDAMVSCRILWEDFGISVHFMDDGLISSRENDKLTLQIRASVDEEESRKRRTRQLENLVTMRREHQRCGRYEPYGWKIDPTRERTTRRGTQSDYLIPDPMEQNHLARLFTLMDTLKSTSKVAHILNAEGIPPKGKPCYRKKPSDPQLLTGHSSLVTASKGMWYASTVQSVLEHSTLADGTHCIVENQGGRLQFTFRTNGSANQQSRKVAA